MLFKRVKKTKRVPLREQFEKEKKHLERLTAERRAATAAVQKTVKALLEMEGLKYDES